MSLLRTAIYTKLSGDAAVSAIVGTNIYPVKLPPTNLTPPYITYFRVSTVRVQSMLGGSQLASPLFQFDAWAKTHAAADDLAEKIRLALEGFKGTVSGVVIGGILFQNQFEEYDEDAELHRVMSEYRIWHEEA